MNLRPLADNALREQEEQDRESNTLRSSPAITGENYLSNYRPYDIVDQNVDAGSTDCAGQRWLPPCADMKNRILGALLRHKT